jgi:hypothetical protein
METKLTYSTLADLLGGVPDEVLTRLPPVQQNRPGPGAAAWL